MNQSDSERSSGEESRSKDIGRLHAIWKNIKEAKKTKNIQTGKKSLGSVKNAIYEEQQKNLQTRLAMTEKQLSKSRQNTTLLMKKLSQAEQQIQYLSVQLEKEIKQKQDAIGQVQQLQYQLLQQQKATTFGHHKSNEDILQYEIQNLKKNLQIKVKDVERLHLKVKSLELDRKNQDNQINSLKQLNQTYKNQLEEQERAMDDIYLGDSKGAQLIELQQANKAIQRLIQILKNTEQYYQLANFASDVQDIHFLKNIAKRLKLNLLNHQPPEKKKMCTCMDIRIEQRLLWTPALCYKTMLEMKMKYQSLTQDCIEEILFELNKIMLARQQNHVKRVRDSYEDKISKLQKKGLLKYDEMVARKQIQRLKKQLTGAKNAKKVGSSINIDSLKTLGQYEDEVRLKQKEIKLLQERIRMIERETSTNDKVLYMEGALWILDKAISEIQNNEEDLREFQVKFRGQIDQELTHEEWIRLYKDFFENITQIQNVLLEKLFMMKQSTLKKMGRQKTKDSLIIQQNRKY